MIHKNHRNNYMGIEDLFPKPEETYEKWIIRLSLEDNDRHRELYIVFQKN